MLDRLDQTSGDRVDLDRAARWKPREKETGIIRRSLPQVCNDIRIWNDLNLIEDILRLIERCIAQIDRFRCLNLEAGIGKRKPFHQPGKRNRDFISRLEISSGV